MNRTKWAIYGTSVPNGLLLAAKLWRGGGRHGIIMALLGREREGRGGGGEGKRENRDEK